LPLEPPLQIQKSGPKVFKEVFEESWTELTVITFRVVSGISRIVVTRKSSYSNFQETGVGRFSGCMCIQTQY
jgi:hypothetical protein